MIYYVWVPKTAGTSMHTAMANHGHELLQPDVQKQIYRTPNPVIGFNHWLPRVLIKDGHITWDEWNECDSFAVVRNPWDRAVSLWKYHGPRLGNIAFPTWLELLRTNPISAAPMRRIRGFSHAAPQTDWTHSDFGMQMVKRIGRFETINMFWRDELCPLFGIEPADLPVLNQNPTHNVPYQDYYEGDRCIRIVEDVYGSDIAAFEYSFDGSSSDTSTSATA